ncbi:cysteine desulfurase family protein [Mucilaginibacter aquatilis]|uniref:cysteine desulfurase n=1 Tax=Mucilaginibacter aquatilis TaxID=1517760 RepID=A0A6I4ICM2_9SPHI|nr:cysteine desulfurase family protein [Mucilaginibacter aquatilis]MVN91179.1 aminotransferase class V-fold PLP-dependent enzyme [Mucilaginibacter aquatilis]
MRIYLDNAATTPIDTEVFNAMTPYLLNYFGNPSSLHQQGREARKAIEDCRASIAELLNASPEEIIFISGGTEADNTAIFSAVYGEGIKHVITTRFEHHAVLHTLESLQAKGVITVSFIKHDDKGLLDIAHLIELLQESPRSLVSVMHANNEIGNLNDIEIIGELCERYNALFHTDTVQTIGHYRHDLQKLKIHFLAASAHKFHGPKGVGFLFCRKGVKLSQLIHGGGQEGRLRAGTENIHGIVGLTKALQIAYRHLNKHQQYIQSLKSYMIERLISEVPGVIFNGNSANNNGSLYTVLNVGLPSVGYSRGLLECFDEHGISVSGGSACSSGAASHVLQAILTDVTKDNIRFSFSKLNTRAEIDKVIDALINIYQTIAA